MPKFDADKHPALCEPIAFTLGGREFTVVEPDDKELEALESIENNFEANSIKLGEALNKKLSVLTGEPETAFSESPIRKKGVVYHWVTAQLTDPTVYAPAKAAPS